MADRVPGVRCPLPLDLSKLHRLFSERRLWKIMEKKTRLMQWCGPGSTWSQDEMLALHSKAVHNTLMRHIRAQSHGAESVQSWLIVMRTAVHLLTEYATHITLPACCMVENGRLASRDQYRENSADWDTNDTPRLAFAHAEITLHPRGSGRSCQRTQQIF